MIPIDNYRSLKYSAALRANNTLPCLCAFHRTCCNPPNAVHWVALSQARLVVLCWDAATVQLRVTSLHDLSRHVDASHTTSCDHFPPLVAAQPQVSCQYGFVFSSCPPCAPGFRHSSVLPASETKLECALSVNHGLQRSASSFGHFCCCVV